MKRLLFYAMAMLVCATSCEKGFEPETDEEPVVPPVIIIGNDELPGDSTELPSNTIVALDVDGFLNSDADTAVWVKGFIVGDCTQKIGNAEFAPPFSHSQALVLADSVGERRKEHLMTVCLTTRAALRKQLNLVDNPQLHGRSIAIHGLKEKYLGVAGIKTVDSYYLYP